MEKLCGSCEDYFFRLSDDKIHIRGEKVMTKILLVDDEEMIIEVLQAYFEKEGWEIDYCLKWNRSIKKSKGISARSYYIGSYVARYHG